MEIREKVTDLSLVLSETTSTCWQFRIMGEKDRNMGQKVSWGGGGGEPGYFFKPAYTPQQTSFVNIHINKSSSLP